MRALLDVAVSASPRAERATMLAGEVEIAMREEITRDEFVLALDRWAGQSIAVRVAHGGDLIAVFHGVLRGRSDEKRPALFWPIVHAEASEGGDHLERPGLYLHRDGFEAASVHVGATVLELRQFGVTLNVRRL